MPRLAINGAAPVRTEPFPSWPMNLEASARAAGETVRSGQWGSIQGEKVSSLEQRFASFQHAAHGIAVCNGTTALCLALQAVGIEPGDEVIVPAYTFIASASSVVMSNAVPVFVDIDPLTYNLDPDRVEEAVTPRTKAIVAVHFAGLPADMDRLGEIAGRHGLAVIEDAAQAHGARWGGRGVGAIGSIGAFSFQSSKNLNAGEGGIMLTNDDGLAAAARSLADCGHAEHGPRYNHFRMAGNNRMTEVQGALLLVQMDHLEAQADLRHANGAYLSRTPRGDSGHRPRGHACEGRPPRAAHLHVQVQRGVLRRRPRRHGSSRPCAPRGSPPVRATPFPCTNNRSSGNEAMAFTRVRRCRP